MPELVTMSHEFEQKPGREIERKLMPVFPEQLASFREQAVPVAQYYLSHPDERFSLRLRETIRDGVLEHTATIKDEGAITPHGLDRMEESIAVSAETYAGFLTEDAPLLHKLRVEPMKHIAIDFFEDGHVQLESEHPIALSRFLEYHPHLAGGLVDISGDRQASSEWRAHLEHWRKTGKEALVPQQDLDITAIMNDIIHQHARRSGTVVQIGGRSGSGKSTLTADIQARLHEYGIPAIILSTDDYNIGKTAAAQLYGNKPVNWDAPNIYRSAQLAGDLGRLLRGETVQGQRFDFGQQEPVQTGAIRPSAVYLIEGLYALSQDFSHLGGLRYTVPTSFAECTGRRLIRDHFSGEREVTAFKTPAETLRHIMEVAEPTYRTYQAQEETQ